MASKVETKYVASVGFTSVALNLSMLIVGVEYNSEEYCKLEASEYIYSRLWNKHRGTLINFWAFFQWLRAY